MNTITLTPILAFKHATSSTKLIDKLQANAVKIWTRSKYFHVELILNDMWISSDTDTGLSIKQLKPLKHDNWEYIELEPVTITQYQYTTLMLFLKQRENSGYDWLGIFLSQFISINTHNKDKYFCSEIVAKILQMLYVTHYLDVIPNNMSPKDIYIIHTTS